MVFLISRSLFLWYFQSQPISILIIDCLINVHGKMSKITNKTKNEKINKFWMADKKKKEKYISLSQTLTCLYHVLKFWYKIFFFYLTIFN